MDTALTTTCAQQQSNSTMTCDGHRGNPITSSQQQSVGVAIATSDRNTDSASLSDSSTEGDPSSDGDSCSSTDEDVLLREAGVMFDLTSITSIDGHAPLELVTQCVSCLLGDHHAAAQLLCQKVMELEPTNETVKEILPLLQERLRLDKELPSESSTEEDETDSVTSSESTTSTDESSTDRDDTAPYINDTTNTNCTPLTPS